MDVSSGRTFRTLRALQRMASAVPDAAAAIAGSVAVGAGVAPAAGATASDADSLRSFSKTSVLFVSISFIILMVISLAWLVFYYVQRFRYAHAKDRLQRRLFNAAKKALARMPAKALRIGDAELDGDCAVCIDPYAAGDVVRMLPCRHVFHKTCIDPWLLEHRTCPMCKADILKAFGYQVCASDRSERSARAISPEPSTINVVEEGGASTIVRVTETHSAPAAVSRSTRMHPSPSAYSPRRPSSSSSSSSSRSSPLPQGARIQRRPTTTASIIIERTRPVRDGSWSGSAAAILPVSARSSSHVVNVVHVRARSASFAPARVATIRQVSGVDGSAAPVWRPPPPAPAPSTTRPSPDNAVAILPTSFLTSIDVIDEA